MKNMKQLLFIILGGFILGWSLPQTLKAQKYEIRITENQVSDNCDLGKANVLILKSDGTTSSDFSGDFDASDFPMNIRVAWPVETTGGGSVTGISFNYVNYTLNACETVTASSVGASCLQSTYTIQAIEKFGTSVIPTLTVPPLLCVTDSVSLSLGNDCPAGGSFTWEIKALSQSESAYQTVKVTTSKSIYLKFTDIQNAGFTYTTQIVARARYTTNATLGTTGPSDFFEFLAPPPSIPNLSSYETVTDISCFGGNDGKIKLDLSGQLADKSYEVDVYDPNGVFINGDFILGASNGSFEVAGLDIPGMYTLQITDKTFENCSPLEHKVELKAPSAALSMTPTVSGTSVTIACFGGSASLDFTIAGGTAPYKYALYESSETQSAFNSFTGSALNITQSIGNDSDTLEKTYNIIIEDDNGCTVTETFTLSQPPPVAFTVGTPNSTNCVNGNDGTVDVTLPSGGTNTYKVELLKGGTLVSTEDNKNAGEVVTFNSLQAGATDYEVKVTEKNGGQCIRTLPVPTIPNQDTISFTSPPTVTPPTCNTNNGTISFEVTGGGSADYSYKLKNKVGDIEVTSGTFTTNTIISSLGGGTYYLEIQASGCADYTFTSGEIMVDDPPPAPAIAVTNTNVGCFDGDNGTITVDISGGNDAVSSFLVGLYTNAAHTAQVGSTQTVNKGDAYTFSKVISAGAYGITAGTYYIKVVESGSTACEYSAEVEVTQPTEIVVTTDFATQLTCKNSNDGIISGSVSGGTGNYRVVLSRDGVKEDSVNTTDTYTFSNLQAGDYSLVIYDEVDHSNSTLTCNTKSIPSTVISDPNDLSITLVTTTDATCKGVANGSVVITLTEGLIYETSNVELMDATTDTQVATAHITQQGNNQFTISRLQAGTYWVRVTLSSSCSYTEKTPLITINEPPNLLSFNTSVSKTPVCHNDNGEITVNASGGDGNYIITITKGGTTYGSTTLNSLVREVPPGTYRVTVSDGGGNGCVKTTTVQVTNPVKLSVNQAITPVTCANGLGSVQFAKPGGFSGTFTYRKDGEANFTTQDTYDLPAGTHTFYVREDDDCEASFTVEIPTDILTASLQGVTALTCINGNDGKATINISGGVAPYKIKLNNNLVATTSATSVVVDGITNSSNTITIEDSKVGDNCIVNINNVTATDPPPLVVEVTKNEAACQGKSSASASATGQSGNYSFEWFKGGSSIGTGTSIANLDTGNDYELVVTDNTCGVSKTTPFSIVLQALPTATVVSKTNTCSATSNDAKATITVNSTTANPVTVLWDNGQTSLTATGLNAGVHQVTVTDKNGCSETFDVTIIPQPQMVIETQQRDVCYDQNGDLANDGLIRITNIQNRTEPTTYQWEKKNASNNWFNYASGTTYIDNLAAGDYRVTVTNGKGCVATKEFTINNPGTLFTYTVATSNVCFGQAQGSATITLSGAFQYSFDGFNYQSVVTNETTFSVSSAEDTLYIKNADACVVYPINIEVIPQINLSVTQNLGVSCIGGSDAVVELSASGGLSGNFLYSRFRDNSFTNDNRFTGLSVGTYTFYVQRNGCLDSVAVTVPQRYTALTTSLNQSFAATCGNSNGSIALNISGGKSPYDITATEVGVGTVVVQNNSTTINSLNAGYHNLVITDDAGCTVTLDSVLVGSDLVIGLTPQDAQCGYETLPLLAGSVLVNVTNGAAPYTTQVYDLQGNPQATSGLVPGEYRVVVTDANSCRGDASFTIGLDNSSAPTMTIQGITPTTCESSNDGSVTITTFSSFGSVNVLWDNGQTTNTATGLSAGEHTVTLTDPVGCVVVKTVTVPIADPMVITAGSISNPICFNGSDGSITVNVANGNPTYTYIWSNGQTNATATGLTAGTYTVTVTDQSGCQQSESFTISNPPSALSLVLINKTDISCNGGADGVIELVASGGWPGAYEYSEDGTNFAPIATTTYIKSGLTAATFTFYVRDANGCVVSLTETFTEPDAITLSIVEQTASICNGANNGTATLSATGGVGNFTFSKNAASGFSSDPTITGLAAGTQWLYAKSNNQCLDSIQVTITEPTALSASVGSFENVTCNGGSDGTITLNISGGNGGYKVSTDGSNFIVGTKLTGLTAGDYTVTVRDAQDCQLTIAGTVTLTEPTAIVLDNLVTDPVACATGKSRAEAFVSGGGGTYTYAWFDTGNNQIGVNPDVEDILPGNYKLVVTDNNGCKLEHPFSITVSAALPDINVLSTTNTSCSAASDGTATIQVVGGIGPVTVLWEAGNQTGLTATNLPAGNNKVTLTDAKGCSVDKTVTISANPEISISLVSSSDPTCLGATDGSIEVNASNGSGDYTFTWSDGQTGRTATNLQAGTTYTVTVTDNNSGCTQTRDFTLNNPASALTLTLVSKTDVACAGNQDGTALITASGGWGGPYLYSRDGINYTTTAATNFEITNLRAGNYIFYAKDNRGCVATTTVVNIGAPDSFTAGVVSQTNLACNGDGNTGSVSLGASGAGSPFTYSANRASGYTSNATFNNLAPGSYTFYVKNSNQCIQEVAVNIVEPTVLSATIDASKTKNVTCKGGNNGEVTLNISGGNAPYKVAANGGTLVYGNLATGLVAGANNITVEDANGCTVTVPATITEPTNALTVTLGSKTNTNCGLSSGSITVNVSGGTSGYTYQWRDSNGNILASTGATINNLGVKVYTVTVTDAQGCSATLSEPIVATGGPDANVLTINNASCATSNDGSATISTPTGVGPVTVAWDNGQNTLTATNLSAGSHTFTLTDGNGCQTIKSVTIGTQPALAFSSSVITPTQCNGSCDGGIQVNVSNGSGNFSFSWNDGPTGNNRTNLCAGNYSVTVTDNITGCSEVATFTVNEPLGLQVSLDTMVLPGCIGGNDGQIQVKVTGGTGSYSYQWAHDAGNTTALATNLAQGLYELTVTDAQGCSKNFQVFLNDPLPISASVQKTTPTCNNSNDGVLTVIPTGGTGSYTYSWTDASNNVIGTSATLSGIEAGTYKVAITDANGCTFNFEYTLDAPLGLSIASSQSPGCKGESDGEITVAALGGTPGYTYNWSDGQTGATASGLSAGNYTVTVTDGNGCVTTFPVPLGEPNALTLTLQSKTEAACANKGSATVVASGGVGSNYTYEWRDPGNNVVSSTATANGLNAGTYTVTVTDDNNCTASLPVTLTTQALPALSVVSTTPASCGNDGTATITITQGVTPVTVTWPNGLTTLNGVGLSTGTQMVTLTDALGCSVQLPVVIPSAPAMHFGGSTVNALNCNGDSDAIIDVQVNNGTAPYEYLWLDGSTVSRRENLAAGSYRVYVTDAKGCRVDTTFIIADPATLQINATTNNPTCFNESDGSIDVQVTGGSGGYVYSWSNGATTSMISGLAAGTYTVTVTDNNGCSDNQSFTLTNPPQIIVNVQETAITCNGGTGKLTITNPSANHTYQWSSATNSNLGSGNELNNITADTYTLTITDNVSGCQSIIATTLNEPSPLVITEVLASKKEPSCLTGQGVAEVSVTGGSGSYTYLWLNSSGGFVGNTAQVTGLGVDTYTVEVRDQADASCIKNATVVIQQAPEMTFGNSIVNSPTCNGDADGSLEVIVTNGAPNYTYLWSTGATTNKIENLAPGSYTVTVTDDLGCSKDTTFMVVNPAPLQITENITNPICGCDGSIDLAITGGFDNNYTYQWAHDGSLTTSNLTNLCPGTYTVTVTDRNGTGCSVMKDITLTAPAAFVNTVNINDAKCFGASDGSIEVVSTSGGNGGAYSYAWKDVNGIMVGDKPKLENVSAGTYSLIITDRLGCTSPPFSYTVGEPNKIMITQDLVNSKNPECAGESNGELHVNVTGGTGIRTLTWSNGQVAQTLNTTGLSAGTHWVVAQDVNGCVSDTLFLTLTDPLPIEVTVNTTGVACNLAQGTATATVINGSGNYDYKWLDAQGTDLGSNTANFTGLLPGNYKVIVTDQNGNKCVGSKDFTIDLLPAPTITTVSVGAASCTAVNNGTATIQISGANTTIKDIIWDDGQFGLTATGLEPREYLIRVIDQNGCEFTHRVTIPLAAPFVVTEQSQTSPSCINGCDGKITVEASNGSGSYTYTWPSIGKTGRSIDGLCAGIYKVTVRDNNSGCEVDEFFTIAPTTAVEVTGQTTSPTCVGGTDGVITVNATGGAGGYTYSWAHDATIDTNYVTGLSAGVNYTVTVTDANGCSKSESFRLNSPNALTASIGVAQIRCPGESNGQLTANLLNAKGVISYRWTTADNPTQVLSTNTSINGLGAGNYVLTVTDQCTTVQATAMLTDPSPLSLVEITAGSKDPTCNGGNDGTRQVQGVGGRGILTYSWSNGQTGATANNLGAGTYTVIVTDAGGCSLQKTFVVTDPAPETIDLPASVAICPGQQYFADPGNIGVQYEWRRNGTVVSTERVLTIRDGGTYQLNVITFKGCNATATIEVTSGADAIKAEFAMVDKAVVGDTVAAIELSLNIPDRIEWKVTGTEEDRTIVPSSLDYEYLVLFRKPGVYTVTLYTYTQTCQDSVSQTIEIFSTEQEAEGGDIRQGNGVQITSATAYPNPTNGKFKVSVKLSEPGPVEVTVINPQNFMTVLTQTKSGESEYVFDLDLTNATYGVYYVRVKTGESTRTIKVSLY